MTMVSAPADTGTREAATVVCLGIGLQVVIDWVYRVISSTIFGGSVTTEAVPLPTILLAYAMTALTCAATGLYCARRPGPGAFIFACQLAFVVVPMQALLSAGFFFADPVFAMVVAGSFLLAVLSATVLPQVSFGRPGRYAPLIVGLLVLISVYTYGALLVRTGGRINFDLQKVYENREELLSQGFPLSGYFISWQGYVINPALFVYGLVTRRRRLLLLAMALQVFLFGMANFRAFLFLPVVLVGAAWLGRSRWLPVYTLLAIAAAVLAGSLVYLVTGEAALAGVLVDRLVMIPGEIHYFYYDYFHREGHDLLYLTQSILSAFGEPLRRPVPEMISANYLGMTEGSANVGLFADAYMNLGLLGCAIFAVLLAVVVRVAESLAVRSGPALAVVLLAAPSLTLVNVGLMTTLLTHGLLLGLLVLWLVGSARTAQ